MERGARRAARPRAAAHRRSDRQPAGARSLRRPTTGSSPATEADEGLYQDDGCAQGILPRTSSRRSSGAQERLKAGTYGWGGERGSASPTGGSRRIRWRSARSKRSLAALPADPGSADPPTMVAGWWGEIGLVLIACRVVAAVAARAARVAVRIGASGTLRRHEGLRGARAVLYFLIPNQVPHVDGAYIDKRIKRNLIWLADHFRIYVTEGSPGRAAEREEGRLPQAPRRGLRAARSASPSTSRPLDNDWSGHCNKRWASVSKLAKWAEPKQNEPLPPFRWVG